MPERIRPRRFAPTLGAELERDRLRARELQLERVLFRLRERERPGTRGRFAMRRAIADFREELDQVRLRLRD